LFFLLQQFFLSCLFHIFSACSPTDLSVNTHTYINSLNVYLLLFVYNTTAVGFILVTVPRDVLIEFTLTFPCAAT
jgi:hypothetical protein